MDFCRPETCPTPGICCKRRSKASDGQHHHHLKGNFPKQNHVIHPNIPWQPVNVRLDQLMSAARVEGSDKGGEGVDGLNIHRG